MYGLAQFHWMSLFQAKQVRPRRMYDFELTSPDASSKIDTGKKTFFQMQLSMDIWSKNMHGSQDLTSIGFALFSSAMVSLLEPGAGH